MGRDGTTLLRSATLAGGEDPILDAGTGSETSAPSPGCCARAACSACSSPSGTPPWSPGRWPATSSRRSPCSTTHGRGVGPAGRRYTADEVAALLADAGFTVEATHAVRVFADLVPGSLLDLEPGATAALVDLERAVAGRPEYLPLATQVHVIAKR